MAFAGTCTPLLRHMLMHASSHLLPLCPRSVSQVLHEVVSRSLHGRNAEGEKKRTVTVQRGHLTNGKPVIGMTMLKADYE